MRWWWCLCWSRVVQWSFVNSKFHLMISTLAFLQHKLSIVELYGWYVGHLWVVLPRYAVWTLKNANFSHYLFIFFLHFSSLLLPLRFVSFCIPPLSCRVFGLERTSNFPFVRLKAALFASLLSFSLLRKKGKLFPRDFFFHSLLVCSVPTNRNFFFVCTNSV